jgi:hypothetical protein
MSLLLLFLLAAPIVAVRVSGQDDAPATRKAESEPKPKPKSRGRLPMYYSRVVNSEQREKIYEIQAKFDKQIADLMAEIKSLQQQRDDEVHGVLTPEQQEEVAQLVAEAQKQRQALKAAKEKVESGDAATDDEEENP